MLQAVSRPPSRRIFCCRVCYVEGSPDGVVYHVVYGGLGGEGGVRYGNVGGRSWRACVVRHSSHVYIGHV